MILKMHKYTFWVYHSDFEDFLAQLQELGVLHICEKETVPEFEDNLPGKIANVERTLKFLRRQKVETEGSVPALEAHELVEDIAEKQKELDEINQELLDLKKTRERLEIWGDFSFETLSKIEAEGYTLKFFNLVQKKYNAEIFEGLNAEIIAEAGGNLYFVVVCRAGETPVIDDAEEMILPDISLQETINKIAALKQKIKAIEEKFDVYARSAIEVLETYRNRLADQLDFQQASQNAVVAVDEKVRVLEGWIPEEKTQQIDAVLDRQDIFCTKEEVAKQDNPPILIKNNRFSKLFEPIGKLFSLPDYREIDLTVFFAPFFMMFFGFCLGDAGYGLLFILVAGIYRIKAKKEIKPVLSLLQYLGLATLIFGVLTGTVFGIDLIKTKVHFLADYKKFFLDPGKMFYLALALGGLQIVFGMFIKVANLVKQQGFAHALSTIGWLVVIMGGIIYEGLTRLNVISPNSIILYAIVIAGGILILFFSDVNSNVFARVGKGIWDVYSTVTGIFGDLLSYIRLFALGLSSAILGFVINDIGLQILGSSKILGPVFFIIFLLLGHTLNILISSLGAFVHPMRLTFVEFYKNSGFKGGGKAYKPFSKKIKI